MPRADLLALTPDDLAALTNRGTVKRALRELEEGTVTLTLTETDAGEVTVVWSDDARCVLPAGKVAAEGRCSCPSTTLCRHVIRSILAYQKQQLTTPDAPAAPPQSWDPGTITDEQLAAHFKKATLNAARAKLDEGLLIELVRSSKPIARFHQLACSLRFVVPHDVRYTHCDCAEQAPCSHVPLAVWAFRRLPADQQAGNVSTQIEDPPVPAAELDSGEELLTELVAHGFSGLSSTWKDRAKRLEATLEDADLIWPAQVLADIAQQVERYASHDARFSPRRAAELVGEWLIRADAIRSGTRAVPQLLVRGSSGDRATEIGSARYVGIGCDVVQDRAGVTVTACLQDVDSGSVVAVAREFPDPAKDSGDTPKDYRQLAAAPHFRGISLAALGAGQLLLQGGKRAPDHQLFVGRAKASVNPQAYAWESLRAPLLAEDFAELRVRLASLPPASLRPRYLAEDLHVIPVVAVEGVRFDEADQAVEMIVTDWRQEPARVHHPFTSRGRHGCEAVLAALHDKSHRLRFIAGRVRSTPVGLLIHPITLVFDTGKMRSGVQPWIDPGPELPEGSVADHERSFRTDCGDSVELYPAELQSQLGDLILLGLRRADAQLSRRWRELARQGEALGFDRLTRLVADLAGEFEQKQSTTLWENQRARQLALSLAVLTKLASDLRSV